MCQNRIITIGEFEQMKAYRPIVENHTDEQRMKHQLLDGIIAYYGEKWWRLEPSTRSAIDFIALMGAQRGFAYPKPQTLRDMYGMSERTVNRRIKELVDAGLMVKAYRRNKNGNSLGNQVYIFVNHPYFADWKALLNLHVQEGVQHRVQHEIAETLTESKSEEPKNSPTYSLPKTNLRELNKRNTTIPSEYARKNVPRDFIAVVKPFFDDAMFIEELWHMVEVDKKKIDGLVDIDFTKVAEFAFMEMVRKDKSGIVRNRFAYFYGTFKKMVDEIIEEDLQDFYGQIS